MDELFNGYIANHNKKFELYVVKYHFELIFEKESSLHIKSESETNLTKVHLKKFLLLWIDYFSERRYIFSHTFEICRTTVSSIRYITNEFYIEQPMQMCEIFYIEKMKINIL